MNLSRLIPAITLKAKVARAQNLYGEELADAVRNKQITLRTLKKMAKDDERFLISERYHYYNAAKTGSPKLEEKIRINLRHNCMIPSLRLFVPRHRDTKIGYKKAFAEPVSSIVLKRGKQVSKIDRPMDVDSDDRTHNTFIEAMESSARYMQDRINASSAINLLL